MPAGFTFTVKPLCIKLGDAAIDLSLLGVTNSTPVDILKKILSKAVLCQGAPDGPTVWSNDGVFYHGLVAKKCQLILSGSTKMCIHCYEHKRYLSRTIEVSDKENLQHPISQVQQCSKDVSSNMSHNLQTVFDNLGIPDSRAAMLIDSLKNEAVGEKTQRRWSPE
jgi:hypothetical protein